MTKVYLEVKKGRSCGMQLRTSEPFVENHYGALIHRVRSIAMHQCGNRRPHLAVRMHCGNTQTGTAIKFSFLPEPPADKFVCLACELVIKKRKLPSSDALVGRHVHKGGVKTYRVCCNSLREKWFGGKS